MKRAFTLIELLVVIAVIAILAAILFPVFAQAKAAAKKTADLSHQKQIVTAIMLYANDHDDHTARSHHDLAEGETIKDLYTWYAPLQPYIKSADVFRDPAMSDTPTLFPYPVTLADWKTYRSDYLINGFFSHGASLGIASRPAEQIILGERHAGIAFFDYHPWPSAPDENWERGFLDGSGYQIGDVDSDSQVVRREERGTARGRQQLRLRGRPRQVVPVFPDLGQGQAGDGGRQLGDAQHRRSAVERGRAMGRFLLLAVALGILAGCSSGESGTVNPDVQQMKAGVRGKRG